MPAEELGAGVIEEDSFVNQGGFPACMAAENLHLEYKGSGLMPKKRVAGGMRVSVGKHAVSAHVQRGSLLLPVGDKLSCARTETSAGSSMQRSSPEVLQGRPGPRWAGKSDALGFDLSDAPTPTQPMLSPAETSLLHAALWAPLETDVSQAGRTCPAAQPQLLLYTQSPLL